MIVKISILILTSVLATIGILFLRKVTFPPFSNFSANSLFDFISQSNLWLGLFFSGVTFLLYMWCLSKYETSFVVPALLGINLVVLSIFSVWFFGESITPTKIGAYGLIFAGMWLLL